MMNFFLAGFGSKEKTSSNLRPAAGRPVSISRSLISFFGCSISFFSRSIWIFGRSISFSARSISIFVSSDFDFRRPAIQNQRRARFPSTICAASMPVHLNRSDLLSPFMSAPKCCRSCCRVRALGNV